MCRSLNVGCGKRQDVVDYNKHINKLVDLDPLFLQCGRHGGMKQKMSRKQICRKRSAKTNASQSSRLRSGLDNV